MSPVYFMQDRRLGPASDIKIGFTERRVEDRQSDYKGGLCHYVMLATMSGGLKEEQGIHRQFEGLRVRGGVNRGIEWFWSEEPLIGFIKRLNPTWAGPTDKDRQNLMKERVVPRVLARWDGDSESWVVNNCIYCEGTHSYSVSSPDAAMSRLTYMDARCGRSNYYLYTTDWSGLPSCSRGGPQRR